jgi:hypothetical protein
MPQQEAYLLLKRLSNQDFGYDVDAWRAWLDENETRFISGSTAHNRGTGVPRKK